jgi:hypothetical protein
MVELGSLQYDKDKETYRGRPHDFYGWDEVTEFSEGAFRFVNGWNRSTIQGQRCRIVATFNPPTTPEAQWIIDYLAPWLDEKHANPAEFGELRWFAVVDGQDIECASGQSFEHKDKRTGKMEKIFPCSRTFIPARLEDNPILEAMGYRAKLQAYPEPLRSQMLYGDMQIGMLDDAWQVIPTAWIRMAQERWHKTSKPDCSMSALGVDVARGGECQTVLAPRYRNWFDTLQKFPGTTTPDGSAVLGCIVKVRNSRTIVNMDVIGYGSSPFDMARGDGIPINAMNGAEASVATDKTGQLHFVNKRAEWYWRLREDLDPASGMDICLPPDRELLSDLTAPRWKWTVHGVQIEAKEGIAKRINRSPDCGDAIVYAHATDGLVCPDALRSIVTPASSFASSYSGSRSNGGTWS